MYDHTSIDRLEQECLNLPYISGKKIYLYPINRQGVRAKLPHTL
jgi:hypothetical protein